MDLEWVKHEDYFEGENLPRAVQAARSVAVAAIDGLVDPIVWFDEFEDALEVLCDADGGDPQLAFMAVTQAEGRFRSPERWESSNRRSKAVRYACWATVIAEVAHRNHRYAQAVVITSAALDKLEEAAGGRPALMRLVASSKPDPLAQAVTAVYAIRVAALRRAGYEAASEEFLRKRTEGVVEAYLSSGRTDPRSHAFSTQALFDEVERGNHQHLPLLREVSDETRGPTLRERTTEPLVAMEHHRAVGETNAANREAKEAEQRLRDFGLTRHLSVLEERGHLVAA